jgi:hypothetical protein
MKNVIIQIAILLSALPSCSAQLCVRTTLNDKTNWTWISANETLRYKTSYGEEKLCVEMIQKLNKIFIPNSWISIEIINIPKNVKASLDIEIPVRKSVPIDEYERATDDEKKMIIPVYCYTQLLGYEYLNQLENPKIIFTYSIVKFELDKFDFDVKEQKVIIDYKNLPWLN